jgi:hypothetical protein
MKIVSLLHFSELHSQLGHDTRHPIGRHGGFAIEHNLPTSPLAIFPMRDAPHASGVTCARMDRTERNSRSFLI